MIIKSMAFFEDLKAMHLALWWGWGLGSLRTTLGLSFWNKVRVTTRTRKVTVGGRTYRLCLILGGCLGAAEGLWVARLLDFFFGPGRVP